MGRTRKQLESLSKLWTFRLLEATAPLARFRPARRLIPWFRPRELQVYCLPVNEDIQLGGSTVLPLDILGDFIERASHRVIVDFCCCREAMSCGKYPKTIGCLMMGESALEIDPSARREVSAREALEHAQAAAGEGLIPMMGKVRLDNLVFGIKNRRQLLSVCFCCECCCISRFARHVPAPGRMDYMHRLEGLKIEVGEACDGCGVCESVCFLREIEMEGDRAVIGEGCVGCGRCATRCKRGAITVTLDNPGFSGEARRRIESLVDIS